MKLPSVSLPNVMYNDTSSSMSTHLWVFDAFCISPSCFVSASHYGLHN